jgi:hypothetical protein
VLGGQQRRRDQQRLGTGGVLDLVRAGPGAEVDQVDPGERGPPAEPGLGAGQFEPWGQETGLLGALAGRKDGEHVFDSPGSADDAWVPHCTKPYDQRCNFSTKPGG